MPNIVVTQKNLEDNHKYLVKYYREFWKYSTPNSTRDSEPFTLYFDNTLSDCLEYNKLKEYNLKYKEKINTEKTDSTKSSELVEKKKSWDSVYSKQFKGEVSSVAFFPDGDFLAIRYEPQHQKIIVFNWRENKENLKFRGEYVPICSCPTPAIISSNGQLIASARIDKIDQNVVKILDIRRGENKTLYGHALSEFGRIFTVALSPDDKIIASAGKDRCIKIWDVKEGLEIDTLSGYLSSIKSIQISPNGEILVSGDERGVIKFWKLRTRQEIWSIEASSLPINSLAFSLDSQMLVSGSDDYRVKLWNVKTGKLVREIGQHSAEVNSVAFSPDGQIIASAGDDYKIRLWELKSKAPSSVLAGHTKKVTSVAFSPDSQTLVSGSKDCTIRIWQH